MTDLKVPCELAKLAVELGFRPAPDPDARPAWGELQSAKIQRWQDKLSDHIKRERCRPPQCRRQSCRRHQSCRLAEILPKAAAALPVAAAPPWYETEDSPRAALRRQIAALRARLGS